MLLLQQITRLRSRMAQAKEEVDSAKSVIKNRRTQKPFIVEERIIRENPDSPKHRYPWATYGRYKTLAAALDAYETLKGGSEWYLGSIRYKTQYRLRSILDQ